MKKQFLVIRLIIRTLSTFSSIIYIDNNIKNLDTKKQYPYIVEIYKKTKEKFEDLPKDFKLGVFYISPDSYQLVMPISHKNQKDYDLVKNYITAKAECSIEKEYTIYYLHAM